MIRSNGSFARPGGSARLAVAVTLAAGLAASASGALTLRSGVEIPNLRQDAALKSQTLRAIADAGESRAILRFDAPVSRADRDRLSRAGVRLLEYVGANAYVASFRKDALAARGAAAALAPASSVHAIEPEWKLHESLRAGQAPDHTIVGIEPASEDKLAPRAERDVMVAVNVVFHRDVDVAGKAAEAVRAAGGEIRTRFRSINGALVVVPERRLLELARQNAVLFVEPPIPAMEELNAENRALTGAEAVQAAPYSLDGSGVVAFIYDGGSMAVSHPDHASRLTVIDSDSVSNHATHVGGTVGGDGTLSDGLERGMAPAVMLLSAGFEFSGSGTFLYSNPGDLETDYENAMVNHGADIANNSIGSNIDTNGFSCAIQGDYGVTSSIIDSIVRGGLTGSPMRIVWAAGNERQASRCDIEGVGDYRSVPTPSGAKNHISVGAVNANDDSMTSFSSWGPVDDGRIIPTVVAPGCQTTEDTGITSTSSSGGYASLCGTSMASPTVTGIGALIIEDYRDQFPDLPMFRNAFLKALLAHTAVDRGNPGPDYQFGYGSVRANAAIDQLRTGNFLEQTVEQGDVYGTTIVVAPGDSEMRVTLAWDDAPGSPLAAQALVNDLDLVVTSPSGARFFPWTLDPADPSADAVTTAVDRVNNIEQVLVENPEPGSWTVEIVGFNVPEGPQPFALVGSPFLVNCSDTGAIRLDANAYTCGAEAVVTVVDCQLNVSDAVIDTVDILVRSTSNPAGVAITLTETAPESGAFTASLTIGDSGTETLLASDGDLVEAIYEDADDGSMSAATVIDSAIVDCAPPVIAGVSVSDITARDAVVTFTTDEPASAVIRWGTDCGVWDDEILVESLETAHSFTLTGLLPETTYFFEVEAFDEAGNFSFDDNNGACFTIDTPEVPDRFTQRFEDAAAASALIGKRLELTPNASNDFYSACLEDVFDLPVSPSGGTDLGLGDDSSTEVVLAGGQTVSLYGEAYSSLFVGPNGYVTFTAGDSDWTEEFSDHFDLPRVAMCFDDLHPGQGGSVLVEQLADRVAVTWLNVRERGTSNEVTGQIELFFDGRVAITWLDNDIDDFIAGVSPGTGLDPDFFESDLASYGACGPRPPFAESAVVDVDVNASATFALAGTDDGLPGGPLVYTITALPTSGVVATAAGQLVTSVPFTLEPGETALRFAPAGGFAGDQQLRFTVDDGGVAPDGGVSPFEGVITFNVGGPQEVYAFLTDDSNPGWSTDGQWAFGTPTGASGSSGGPDPTSGHTGQNVYGYNLQGGYGNNIPRHALTTGPIDCRPLTGVQLEFQRWLGVESAQYDDASLEISVNDGPWSVIWAHSGGSFTDSDWTRVSYDLSSIADGQVIQLRWVMGASDFIVDYCGWNIDDVRILAETPSSIECPHDLTGDRRTDAADLAVLIGSWGGVAAGYSAGDIDGNGVIDAADIAALVGSWNPAGCP